MERKKVEGNVIKVDQDIAAQIWQGLAGQIEAVPFICPEALLPQAEDAKREGQQEQEGDTSTSQEWCDWGELWQISAPGS